jgi:hypothetical protein
MHVSVSAEMVELAGAGEFVADRDGIHRDGTPAQRQGGRKDGPMGREREVLGAQRWSSGQQAWYELVPSKEKHAKHRLLVPDQRGCWRLLVDAANILAEWRLRPAPTPKAQSESRELSQGPGSAWTKPEMGLVPRQFLHRNAERVRARHDFANSFYELLVKPLATARRACNVRPVRDLGPPSRQSSEIASGRDQVARTLARMLASRYPGTTWHGASASPSRMLAIDDSAQSRRAAGLPVRTRHDGPSLGSPAGSPLRASTTWNQPAAPHLEGPAAYPATGKDGLPTGGSSASYFEGDVKLAG